MTVNGITALENGTAVSGSLSGLDPFFSPRTVALIGATDRAGSVGASVWQNLKSLPAPAKVIPVNPARRELDGVPCVSTIDAVKDSVDLAVIVTPAATVPKIIGTCADRGVKAALVISAGFKEFGPTGEALERDMLAHVRRSGMRLVGPNCLGLMRPSTGLNATFAQTSALPGSVGFISQSGALCTAILDWSLKERVGFSAFVSIGSMLDVGWGDLIEYLGDDPLTKSILLYMESIGDPGAFLSAARRVSSKKPIIVIKVGRSEAAAKAAASHTGSLTGRDDVLDAAFKRCGVLRVDRISELFQMAEVLAKQPHPRGGRLTILTNAGGPGVIAADAVVETGGTLAELSPDVRKRLDALLPPHWSRNNPIDILGDASAELYEQTVKVALENPESDGLLVVLSPQAMTDPGKTAERLAGLAHATDKPLLASWMGGLHVAEGEAILNRAGIPTFPFPDQAVRIFEYMVRQSENLKSLYETPEEWEGMDEIASGRETVSALIAAARTASRLQLPEEASKRLLSAYGIPVVPVTVAGTSEAAAEAADRFGYPVAVKLHSERLTHKTDVGGVILNVADRDAVTRAFEEIRANVTRKAGADAFQGVAVEPMIRKNGTELIIGSSVDTQFGPVLLFGTGGKWVETFQDVSLGLPPLTRTLARRMMENTKILRVLQGARGQEAADLAAVEALMVRFSQLVVDHPAIKEIEINPLLVGAFGCLALDARVVLYGSEVEDARLPKPAIRPYPSRYVSTWTLPDGQPVTLRPIRPEDEPMLASFHHTLSTRTVHMRYFSEMPLAQRLAHERLARGCFIDYDREMAIVADHRDPVTGVHDLLGVGRLFQLADRTTGELAIVVKDPYQGRGVGRALVTRMVEIAKREGLTKIVGDILAANVEMQRLLTKFGFEIKSEPSDPTTVTASLRL